MEEKAFPKKEKDFGALDNLKMGGAPKAGGGIKSKIAHASNRVFSIIKLILGLCLLVFVYSSTISFLSELNLIGKRPQNYLWLGVVSFIIVYFFIYEPAVIYKKGHRILELVFKFFAPLVKMAPYVLPIYTIVIFCAYLLLSIIIKTEALLNNTLFLLGFSLVLHLVFSAKSIRSKQGDFLKSNYIFGFSLIYIINFSLLAFFLSSIFEKFSVVNFFNNSFHAGKAVFDGIFRQLFL